MRYITPRYITLRYTTWHDTAWLRYVKLLYTAEDKKSESRSHFIPLLTLPTEGGCLLGELSLSKCKEPEARPSRDSISFLSENDFLTMITPTYLEFSVNQSLNLVNLTLFPHLLSRKSLIILLNSFCISLTGFFPRPPFLFSENCHRLPCSQ